MHGATRTAPFVLGATRAATYTLALRNDDA